MSLPGAVSPSREDRVVAAASEVVGGPAGSRVAPGARGWWTAVRVLVALSMVVLCLGVVEKQHCASAGWSTPDQFWHACYSDLPVVYETSGLASGTAPYAAVPHPHYLQQPVLTGLTLWLTAKAVPHGTVISQERWYFDIWIVIIAVLLAALVAITVASARGRPWDGAHVALSPLLVLLALVSADLFGVTLAAAGLLAWGRRRPLLAGVLLGLAISARTYPILLVLTLGLLAIRSGRLPEWSLTAGGAVCALLVVELPWALSNPDGVAATYRAWRDSAAGYGSPWLIPGLFGPGASFGRLGLPGFLQTALAPGTVTAFAVLGWIVAIFAGALLALGAPRRPRVAQVALVVVAIVLLTGKSFPVQDSLWLVPLVALAHPRWRDHLAWFVCEAAYFVAVWLYAAAGTTPDRGLPGRAYVWFIVVRLLAVGGLVVLTWREAWRSERDVVRHPPPEAVSLTHASAGSMAGEGTWPVDDPLGGPLEGAPDRVIVSFA